MTNFPLCIAQLDLLTRFHGQINYAGLIYDFMNHIEIFQTIYFGNETEEEGCCAVAQGQPPTIAAGGHRKPTATVPSTASHKT